MSIENVTELGIETRDAVQQVLQLAGALGKYGNRLDQISGVTVTFTKTGKLAKITVTELVDGFNKASETFANTKKGLVQIGASASDATARLKELANAQKSIREGVVGNRAGDANFAAAAEAKRVLTDAFQGPNVGNASKGELNAFKTAVASITNEVGKGKTSLGELNAVFVKAASGASDLTIREQAVVDKFNAMKAAANEFGNSAINASNRAARSAQVLLDKQQQTLNRLAREKQAAENRAQLPIAQAAVGQAFASQLGSATPQQLINFNNQIRQALLLLEQGKVSAKQFTDTLNNVKSGNIQTGLPKDLDALQSRLYRAGQAFGELGKVGENAGKRILLSFQSVVRIFEGQLLYHAFSKLQNEFTQSIHGAAEYSRSIALIQTISQDANLSSREWSESIRKVSDELGNPIAETASAAYDLLSNQVTRGKDTIDTLRTALEFGRTTNANATDSVNLISSAINSFNLKASDAGRVSRTFFTTIDLGRVTASELANSFGRTGTLAHSLGVTLEETQAGISTLTRQGIKANESYTLLNNVFLKLIKPTEALQGFLHKIGFETGQDAIQALGFVGVLQALDKEFAGNASAATKYFDELRGARGILNLTGKGLRDFQSDLKQTLESSGTFDIAKQIVGESSGQKLFIELNKIKNFFVNEIGGSVLRAVINVSDNVGGLGKRVVQVVQALKLLAVAAVTAFTIIKINVATQALGVLLFKLYEGITAFGLLQGSAYAFGFASQAAFAQATLGVSLIAGAIAGAVIAYNELADRSFEAGRTIENAHQESGQKIIDAEKEFSDKRQTVLETGLEKSKQSFLSYLATLRIGYEKTADKLKDIQSKITESFTNSFDVLRGILSKSVTELENKAKDAEKNIENATKAITETRRDAGKELFDRNFSRAKSSKDFGGEQSLVNARVNALRKQAATDLFDNHDLEAGKRSYEEIRRILGGISTEREKIARFSFVQSGHHTEKELIIGGEGKTRNVRVPNFKLKKSGTDNVARFDVVGAEQAIAHALREEEALLKSFIVLEKQRRDEAAKFAEQQKRALLQTEDDFKKLKEFSLFDKKGNVKEEFEGEAGRAKAAAELKGLQAKVVDDLAKGGATIPQQVAVIAAFQDQFLKFKAELGQQTGNFGKEVASAKQLEDLTAAGIKVKAAFEGAVDASKVIKTQIDETGKASVVLRGEIAAIAELLKTGVGNAGLSGGTREELLKSLEDLSTAAANAGTEGADRTIRESIQKIVAKIKSVDLKGALGGEGILQGVIKGADPNDPNGVPLRIIGGLERIKAKVAELKTLDFKLGNAETAYAGVQRQVEALKTQLSELPDKFKDSSKGADVAGEAIAKGLDPAIEAAKVFSGQLATVIRQLQTIEGKKLKPDSKGEVEGKRLGGPVGYYADGGFLGDFLSGKFASGVDRVPIMAARGEYVVNSEQTRQFLPLLRAINSGQLGSLKGAGQTTTVGDINITVQGGSSSSQTVKGIANELRRGLRTGAIRI